MVRLKTGYFVLFRTHFDPASSIRQSRNAPSFQGTIERHLGTLGVTRAFFGNENAQLSERTLFLYEGDTGRV